VAIQACDVESDGLDCRATLAMTKAGKRTPSRLEDISVTRAFLSLPTGVEQLPAGGKNKKTPEPNLMIWRASREIERGNQA